MVTSNLCGIFQNVPDREPVIIETKMNVSYSNMFEQTLPVAICLLMYFILQPSVNLHVISFNFLTS